MRVLLPLVVLAVLAFVLVPQVFFRVDQTQFAVVKRFGEIQTVVTQPGLKVKTPFVEQVSYFDNRLLRIDVPPQTMPDKDKQSLEIDAYVRYKIIDPRKFLLKLQDVFIAEGNISRIVSSSLREEVGRTAREDIIGGSIIAQEAGIPLVEKRTVTIGDQKVPSREAMLLRVRDASDRLVKSTQNPNNDFGITIVDVRIRAADFPTATEQSIFTRMRTEREVQANKLRAEGEEEYQKITSDVDRQQRTIAAQAEASANATRGDGEARAIAILATALQKDPEFYAFRRSLEAYKKSFNKQTTVVLSAESDLFRYLQSPLPLSQEKDRTGGGS